MVDRLFSESSLAALYDLFSPWERRSDFHFYLPFIMSARAVLDVGCGTGAMLHRARESGHTGRLCGLDPAPGMLEQARKRADIEWILGDLASVSFDREFDLVVMTGHAFQVLVEDRDLRAALASIRSALTDDGCFAFETRNPLVREWSNGLLRNLPRSPTPRAPWYVCRARCRNRFKVTSSPSPTPSPVRAGTILKSATAL